MHLDRDKTSETKWTDGKGIQIDFSLQYIFLISGAKIPKRRFSSIISSSYHLFFHHLVLISPPLLFISHITRWIHERLMTTAEIDRSIYFMQPTHISSMLRPKKASSGKKWWAIMLQPNRENCRIYNQMHRSYINYTPAAHRFGNDIKRINFMAARRCSPEGERLSCRLPMKWQR